VSRRWSYPVVGRRVGVRDGERVDDGVEAHELFRMLGLLRTRTERAHAWVCRRGRGHIRGTFCRDLARHCVDPRPLSTPLHRSLALDPARREIARSRVALRRSDLVSNGPPRWKIRHEDVLITDLPADPSHLSLIFRSASFAGIARICSSHVTLSRRARSRELLFT